MKLQQISDISPTIAFTEFDILQKYRESFRISELGRIRSLLPIKEMAKVIKAGLEACRDELPKAYFFFDVLEERNNRHEEIDMAWQKK